VRTGVSASIGRGPLLGVNPLSKQLTCASENVLPTQWTKRSTRRLHRARQTDVSASDSVGSLVRGRHYWPLRRRSRNGKVECQPFHAKRDRQNAIDVGVKLGEDADAAPHQSMPYDRLHVD